MGYPTGIVVMIILLFMALFFLATDLQRMEQASKDRYMMLHAKLDEILEELKKQK